MVSYSALFLLHVSWLYYGIPVLAFLALIRWLLNRKQLEATPTELAELAERILEG